VDRLTRKELKTDRFALEVGNIVDYLSEHRREAIRYGIAAAVVLVVVFGIFFQRRHQQGVRREALETALRTYRAEIGPAGEQGVLSFPTRADRDKAATKALSDLASRYSGSEEADVARYHLGVIAADQGRLADAEKMFREAADSGGDNYGSLAKLALAEVYAGQGKYSEAEKLLRSLMAKPTLFVSKEQAAIELAKLLTPVKPEEARKLLEPLRTEKRSAVSRTALTLLSSLPPK
jgi:predicted negative regulator of RcsB-dependent stress response